VLPAVPDLKTVKKDWERAKVAFTDEGGRRLDFHAFRHTFSTNLDRTGCSRATRKKLERHAHEDVTDGYGHAELAEMLAGLKRLPAPDAPREQAAVRAGTDDSRCADQLLDQSMRGGAKWCEEEQGRSGGGGGTTESRCA